MSAHADIAAKYRQLNDKLVAKRQQGLSATEVTLSLQEGIDIVKLMVKLAEEVSSHGQVVSTLTPKGGPQTYADTPQGPLGITFDDQTAR